MTSHYFDASLTNEVSPYRFIYLLFLLFQHSLFISLNYPLLSVHLSPIQPSVHPFSHRPVTWSQVIGLRQFGLHLSLHMIPNKPAWHSNRKKHCFYFQRQKLFLIQTISTEENHSTECMHIRYLRVCASQKKIISFLDIYFMFCIVTLSVI